MSRPTDLILTALAPAIWGSTYFVTTEFLPQGFPITLSVLRALPAGLLLLLLVRQLPPPAWIGRVLLLGAFNFAIFWVLLFISAYRLPGGVAATLGATQPLIVLLLARLALGHQIRPLSVLAALTGLGGVALLVLGPNAALDPLGVAAGLGGAVSMAAGTVFSRKWQPPVPPLTFTAWQLTAGGLLLVPVALIAEPMMPLPDGRALGGLLYLGLIGAALTYLLWFRGIARIEPAAIAMLGMMSPVTAVLLGWLALGQNLSGLQMIGVAAVLGSVWLGQRAARPAASPPRRMPA